MSHSPAAVWVGALSGCAVAIVIGVIFICIFYIAQNAVFSGQVRVTHQTWQAAVGSRHCRAMLCTPTRQIMRDCMQQSAYTPLFNIIALRHHASLVALICNSTYKKLKPAAYLVCRARLSSQALSPS